MVASSYPLALVMLFCYSGASGASSHLYPFLRERSHNSTWRIHVRYHHIEGTVCINNRGSSSVVLCCCSAAAHLCFVEGETPPVRPQVENSTFVAQQSKLVTVASHRRPVDLRQQDKTARQYATATQYVEITCFCALLLKMDRTSTSRSIISAVRQQSTLASTHAASNLPCYRSGPVIATIVQRNCTTAAMTVGTARLCWRKVMVWFVVAHTLY